MRYRESPPRGALGWARAWEGSGVLLCAHRAAMQRIPSSMPPFFGLTIAATDNEANAQPELTGAGPRRAPRRRPHGGVETTY